MSRDIKLLVIHCSATKPSLDIGAHEIRDWHTMPKLNPKTNMYRYLGRNYGYHDLPKEVQGRAGRGWSDIGYHGIVRRNGVLQHGRDLAASGAHARGYNKNSIGICLIGGVDGSGAAEDNFDVRQFHTLRAYIDTMAEVFPGLEVAGHRDLSVDLNEDGVITPDEWMKDCPCFNVKEWYYG